MTICINEGLMKSNGQS
uniref:Uncharacterized protein n=1 Tax=Anguilla anguilla TaxID=7936 RepID=A0A0E9SEV6_ANGAN